MAKQIINREVTLDLKDSVSFEAGHHDIVWSDRGHNIEMHLPLTSPNNFQERTWKGEEVRRWRDESQERLIMKFLTCLALWLGRA